MSRSVWRGDLIRARGTDRNERAEEGEALNPLATAMEAEAERERQAATALGAMLRLSIWRSMNRGERRARTHGVATRSFPPSRLSSVAHEIWKRIFSDRQTGRFIQVLGNEKGRNK